MPDALTPHIRQRSRTKARLTSLALDGATCESETLRKGTKRSPAIALQVSRTTHVIHRSLSTQPTTLNYKSQLQASNMKPSMNLIVVTAIR